MSTATVTRLATVVAVVAGLVSGAPAHADQGQERIARSIQQYRWTHVSSGEPDRSYWEADRADGARVGFSAEPRGVFRSFFQFDTSAVEGARVYRAEFVITPRDRNNCAPIPLEAWETAPIDPAVPLTWNNSGKHWLGGAPLDARTWPRCDAPVMRVEFESPELLALVQRAADEGTGFVSLGMRVANERNRMQGMRFTPEEAYLLVDYNNPPDAPRVGTRFPKPCGTADAPTPLTPSTADEYVATATDPDGDHVTTRLEILDSAGAVVHSSEVGPVVSGAAFAWPELPAGVLEHGRTYRYRAVTRDDRDTGPYSQECYFTVDGERPGTPRIESTDYPDGEPAILARTTGTLTLRASGPDTTEFLFGFQQDTITSRIKAGPDGTAILPVTLTEDQFGSTDGRLFVRAVDAAGNPSTTIARRDLAAFANPAPRAHERGDTTGDGRADVSVVLDHGFGQAMAWNLTAGADGFHQGYVALDTGGGGSFADRIRTTRADFDGDGQTDTAVLYHQLGSGATLQLFDSNGNDYDAFNKWHSPQDESWPIADTQILSGDVDADSKADVVLRRPVAGGWEVRVLRGDALNAPAVWYTSATAGRLLAGDADGDGRTDLVELRDHGDCRTSLLVHHSTGTAFAEGTTRWDSGPGGLCLNGVTATTGDLDGDTRDDVVLRDNATGAVTVLTADGFTPLEWLPGTGEPAGPTELATGDFDLDGKGDLAVVRACCVPGGTQVWTLRSTGTAFTDRELAWEQTTGGTLLRP